MNGWMCGCIDGGERRAAISILFPVRFSCCFGANGKGIAQEVGRGEVGDTRKEGRKEEEKSGRNYNDEERPRRSIEPTTRMTTKTRKDLLWGIKNRERVRG